MTENLPDKPQNKSEILFYQTEDGSSRIQVRLEDKTVWLTQAQMAELFQTTVPNVSMHIRNIFAEKELIPGATVKDFLIVQPERLKKKSPTLLRNNNMSILTRTA